MGVGLSQRSRHRWQVAEFETIQKYLCKPETIEIRCFEITSRMF